MKKFLILFGLLLASPSFAADNTVIVTPGIGVTMKSKDIGAGVQAMQPVLSDTGGNALSTPTAGADAVSNTSTGLLSYGRNLVFNGTTWDRWLGDATNGGFVNVKTSVIPTGASTSANQTSELTKLDTIITNTGAAIPAGSAIIGKVGIDQTTPGTTNNVAVSYGAVAAVADPCQTATKIYTPINVVTATNTIITGVAAKKKYVCGIFLYPAGVQNVAIFQATTATACATALVGVIGGTTTATGMVMTAQAGFVLGNGAAAVAATTVNQTDLCIVTSAAVQLSGVVVTVDQ